MIPRFILSAPLYKINYINMKFISALICLSICAVVSTHGSPVDPVNSVLDRTLQEKRSDSSDSPTNQDGGDLDQLKRTKKPVKFRVGIYNDVEYQSNADRGGNSGKGSAVWLPGTEAGLNWKIAPQWFLESVVSASAGLYSSTEEQNFLGLTSKTVLRYHLGKHLPFIYAGPDLYRYQSLDTGDETNRGVAPKVGISYGHRFKKTKTLLFSDIRYQHHFVSPAGNNRSQDRDSVRIVLGVTQQLTDRLFAQAYYEYSYLDYSSIERIDSRNTLGGSLIWEATKNLSLSLSASFTDNDSSNAASQFQTINTGMGSSLIWRF